MPVRLRLQRHGRKKRPFYLIVAADSRVKRDGKFIDRVGSYDPTTIPATIELDGERALKWLHNGAEPTNTVRAILSFKGVLYKKHLMRGVAKGALTEEEAEAKYQEWIGQHDLMISEKRQKREKELRSQFEAIEARAREKREKESALRSEAAAKERQRLDEEQRKSVQVAEEGEKPQDIDSVAREAAIERGEIEPETTETPKAETGEEQPVAEQPEAKEPAANSEDIKES